MRCTGCNYPLWNLKARACPECGLAFCPSEHEFLPNSVRFCCPHCDQSYYGTDGRGHLVPSAFACVSCGRDVEMDAMVLRPAEGVAEAQTRVDDHPWLERANRGVMRGWFATIGRAMVAPGRLMRATPAEGSLGSAWWFIIATSIIVFGLGIGIPFFVIGLIAAFASGDWMEPVLIGASFVGGGVVFTLLMVAVWGLVTHMTLVATGGAAHPIGRTYQALCYSGGANVTTAMPCLGVYPFLFVGLVWWIVSAIFMVGEGQRVSGGRATLAVLALPALFTVLALVGSVGAMYWGLGQAQIAVQSATLQQPHGECSLIVSNLIDFAETDGVWPAHASELIRVGPLTGFDMVAAASDTFESDVPLGDSNLETLATAPEPRREEAIAAASARMPSNVIAHRLGDFVFTYHGVPVVDPPAELWLVVLACDPDRNVDSGIAGSIFVGTADGLVDSFLTSELAARLAEQNGVRQTHGLPPLPALDSITHATPATGG